MSLENAVQSLLMRIDTVHNRNKGHTMAALAHAKNIDAIFIAANQNESKRLGIKHVSYRDPRQLMGIHQPIVIDHHVWEMIARDLLIVIDAVREEKNKKEELLRKIHQLSAEF